MALGAQFIGFVILVEATQRTPERGKQPDSVRNLQEDSLQSFLRWRELGRSYSYHQAN